MHGLGLSRSCQYAFPCVCFDLHGYWRKYLDSETFVANARSKYILILRYCLDQKTHHAILTLLCGWMDFGVNNLYGVIFFWCLHDVATTPMTSKKVQRSLTIAEFFRHLRCTQI